MAAVPETFRKVVELLEAEGVPFVVIGGLAAGLQGDPRMTNDVDFMVSVRTQNVPDLARAARSRGFEVEPELAETQWVASGFFRMWGGDSPRVAVDLMTSNSDFFREVVWRAEPARLFGCEVYVASPEDVLLLKVMAWRMKDLGDIAAIVSRHRERLDRAYLRRWAAWLGEKGGELEAAPERLSAVLEGRPGPPARP